MIANEEVDIFLEHFGIKGMQWGVRRNFDELKKSHANRKEVGARKYEVKAAVMQTKINALSIKLAKTGKYSFRRDLLTTKIETLSIKKQRALKDAEAKRKGGFTFTSNQKKAALGAGFVAAAIVAARLSQTGGEDITSAIRRRESKRKFGSIFRIDKSLANTDLTPDQVLNNVAKTVNPNYNSMGGKMNCRRSTFAYELRRRGYSVDATPSAIGRGQSETGLVNALIRGDRTVTRASSLSSMIVGGKGVRGRPTSRDTRAYSAFTKTVKGITGADGGAKRVFADMPNGARGEIVFNQTAFGHSMAWEKFKDGAVHIFDTQKGTKYSVSDNGLFDIMQKWGTSEEMAITRLDDVDLDLKFLSRWARNSA